jgi:hypothetical protein
MKKTLFKKAYDTNVNRDFSNSMNYAYGATFLNDTTSSLSSNVKIDSKGNSNKISEVIQNDHEIRNRSSRANSFSCKYFFK